MTLCSLPRYLLYLSENANSLSHWLPNEMETQGSLQQCFIPLFDRIRSLYQPGGSNRRNLKIFSGGNAGENSIFPSLDRKLSNNAEMKTQLLGWNLLNSPSKDTTGFYTHPQGVEFSWILSTVPQQTINRKYMAISCFFVSFPHR